MQLFFSSVISEAVVKCCYLCVAMEIPFFSLFRKRLCVRFVELYFYDCLSLIIGDLYSPFSTIITMDICLVSCRSWQTIDKHWNLEPLTLYNPFFLLFIFTAWKIKMPLCGIRIDFFIIFFLNHIKIICELHNADRKQGKF